MQPPPLPTNIVNYQLSKKEIVTQAFLRRMLRLKKVLLYGIIILLGIALLFTGDRWWFIGWYFIVLPFLIAFFFYRSLGRLVNQHSELTEPHSIAFDENGVTVSSAHTQNQFSWKRIQRLTQNRDYYHLHLNDMGGAVTLPKRAFTPEQTERFVSLAKLITA